MALDLLTWPELRDAEADLLAARARYREAQRRWRLAPHGQRTTRLRALQEAVQGSLSAELRLARVRSSIRRSSSE